MRGRGASLVRHVGVDGTVWSTPDRSSDITDGVWLDADCQVLYAACSQPHTVLPTVPDLVPGCKIVPGCNASLLNVA